ncbi:hypothetical protein ACLB2K_064984 [Fragaria x ananassa]
MTVELYARELGQFRHNRLNLNLFRCITPTMTLPRQPATGDFSTAYNHQLDRLEVPDVILALVASTGDSRRRNDAEKIRVSPATSAIPGNSVHQFDCMCDADELFRRFLGCLLVEWPSILQAFLVVHKACLKVFAPKGGALEAYAHIDCFNKMESDDDQVYIPQAKSEVVPKLKQEFETMEDVATFYNRYAKEAGFSIRSHTSAKNKDNTTFMRKEYVCYKQGVSKVQGEKRKRGLPKVGCKARIAAMRKKYGGYVIYVFVKCHNHPLASPTRVPFLKSHRRISIVDELLYEQLSLVNVKRHKQFELFGVKAGGIENIGFTQRDLYNYGSTIHQEKKGILKRQARQSLALNFDEAETEDNKALLARRIKLLQYATYVVDKAIVSDEASQLLMDLLDAFLVNFKSLNVDNESG